MEKKIFDLLKREVTRRGGKVLKYHPFSAVGMPDCIVLGPKGRICWVELKDTGKRPRAVQTYRLNRLRAMGQRVYVVDDAEGVKEVADYISGKSYAGTN